MDLVCRVKRFPGPDENILVDRFMEMPGGSAANVSMGLARLGISAGFVGTIGDDRYGQILLEEFRREGVDISRIRMKENSRSASTFIAVDEGGHRIIYSLGGTALLESPDEIDGDYLKGAKFLYLGLSFPRVAERAMRYARSRNVQAFVCLEGVSSIWGPGYIRKICKSADLISSSGREASSLMGEDDPIEAGKKLMSYGGKAVAITVGEEGCVLFKDGKVFSIPAFKIKVVDTTGAGDAFNAGLISGILRGMNLEDAARFGNATAAIKVGHLGARSGMPRWGEVEGFLKNRKTRIKRFSHKP